MSAPGAPTPPAQDTDGAAANERTPLALAAAAGHARCVAVLLRHGAAVDLATLRHAVWSLSVPGVQALLAAGRGRLPPTQPCTLAEGPLNCPVVLLLVRHLELAAAAAARPRPAASLAALASQAVRIMDLLLDAGYRIKVYRGESLPPWAVPLLRPAFWTAAVPTHAAKALRWKLGNVRRCIQPPPVTVLPAACDSPAGLLPRRRRRHVREGRRRRVAHGARAGAAGGGAAAAGCGGAQPVRRPLPAACAAADAWSRTACSSQG